MSAATSEATRAAANENVAVSARPPLPAIEATIIDIPSAFSTSCASPSSSSASSSSYDTDCSTASSTCCAHHGEHVYMQRSVAAAASAGVGIGVGVCIDAAPTQCSEVELDVDVDGDAEAEAEADVELRQFKAEQRRSWPFFMLAISLIEIGVFVFDYMTVKPQPELHAPIPTDSVLIYRPDRRQQLWRFVSYMVLHANWFHLSFNVVVQLLFGVPLEVMHGSARIAVIYLAGVFAGSLGTSVVDSEVYLVGASGGVYALLAAHLANIVLNYGQMRYAVAQLVSVLIFVSCDLGYAVYTQYLDVSHFSEAPAVSYIAHLTGALAGLTIGLLVLKNFERKAHENLIWWLALGVWTAFTIFAIVFNLINTVTAQLMEEQGEVITQHLLHDLGVS